MQRNILHICASSYWLIPKMIFFSKLQIWFQVHTAQSQHSNVCESHSMECKSVVFVTNGIPYLWRILNFFQQCLWFLWLQSCFIKIMISERTKHEALHLQWQLTQNSEFISCIISCKMLQFVMSYMKKNKHKQTLECTVQPGNHL